MEFEDLRLAVSTGRATSAEPRASLAVTVSRSAAYLAYAGGWAAVRRMPERLAYRCFDHLADHLWRTRSAGVCRLEANLTRVLGPGASPEHVREVSRTGMRSYMRYWCDTFRLPGWDDTQMDSFELSHAYRLSEPLAAGRGVIIALPHMGNWDHAGAWVTARIAKVTTVAEQVEPAKLFEAFVRFREARGIGILAHGQPGAYDTLAEIAANAGLVALLADRDLSASGIEVQFFGETARFPAGPAALAVDTGAVIAPVALFRDGTHNAGEVLAYLQPATEGDRTERIRATTQALAKVFEASIRAHPSDWHMLQRVWLGDLDPARSYRGSGIASPARSSGRHLGRRGDQRPPSPDLTATA